MILSIVVALGFAALAWFLEGEVAFQSGPLILKHSSVDTQCARCHDPWGPVSNKKCQSCHLDVFARDPNHGKPKPHCSNCHIEHQGRRFDLKAAAKRLKRLS